MAKKRVASVSLATKDGNSYNYDNFGAQIADPEYPGSTSIILEIDHPTRKDGKFPLRGKATVIKFVFPPEEGSEEAEEAFVDITESFINSTFWHAIERSPKAKG